MFYLIGTHHEFGNVIYVECVTVGKQLPGVESDHCMIRPTPCVLHAEAFNMRRVETMRQLMRRTYPDYKWLPVGADSSQLIPENMRRTLKLA